MWAPKKKTRNLSPYRQPNQSIKSIIEDSCPRHPLDHSKKLHKKEKFNSWSEISTFSKAFLFLFFQIVENKQSGVTFQPFFLLFPMERLCQLRSVAWTKVCNTHTTQNKKTSYHNIFALKQRKRMWSQDSSSPLHSKHLLTNVHPLLFKMSKVRILFHIASQTKKTQFCSNPRIPNNHCHKRFWTPLNHPIIEGFN